MSILLTGATGFLGSFISNNDNYDIRCVVRENNSHKFKSIFTITNLDGQTKWEGAFSQVETVIHLAGLAHSNSFSSEDYHTVNVDGTLNLASQAASAGVKRFVFVSSIGVNGTCTQNEPYSFDSPELPHNVYAQSKYNAEVGLKMIAKETGLEVVIVRPTLVYGPNAPGNFGILTKLVKKLSVFPFGNANNKRDFIAVQNLADLLIICATHPNAASHTFLASDMETVSIKQFTNAIAAGLGKKVLQLPIPASFMRLAGKLIGKSTMVEQLLGNLQVDSSNVKDVLDWTPPLTMKQAMATLRDSGK